MQPPTLPHKLLRWLKEPQQQLRAPQKAQLGLQLVELLEAHDLHHLVQCAQEPHVLEHRAQEHPYAQERQGHRALGHHPLVYAQACLADQDPWHQDKDHLRLGRK